MTIRNGAARPSTVATVRSCEFQVGVNQTGVLLVNTAVATIEQNRISLRGGTPPPVDLTRGTLVSNLRMGEGWSTAPAERTGRAEVWINLWDDQSLVFRTDAAFEDVWSAVFESRRDEFDLEGRSDEVTTDDRRRIRDFIERAVTQILRSRAAGPLTNSEMNRFRRAMVLRQASPLEVAPAAQQGVVVGGAIATDVRILHNRISGTRHGIRVGLSRERTPTARHADPVIAEQVQIVGNSIRQVVPADQGATHAGIFVGNVEAATIRDNRVECEREGKDVEARASRRAEAIRVWGVPGGEDGHFLLITGNVSRRASTGIRVHQVNQPIGDTLVQITQNLAMACNDPLQVHGAFEVALDNRP